MPKKDAFESVHFPPMMDEEEIEAVIRVLKSKKLTLLSGKRIKKFEKEYAKYTGTKYAIAAMRPNGGGSIVNLGSVSGIRPSGGATAYCASKAAVRMFSKAVAIECVDAKTGIRVNLVTPGGVKTPMWEQEDFFRAMISEYGSSEAAFAAMAGDTPSHQFFSPEEIARTLLYLASDDSSHLTGTEIVVDRGHTG